MTAEGSITLCLDRLRAGDPDAADRLWGAYIRRLVGLARDRLRSSPRRVADEEDVALSAFESFCRRAAGGGFARLASRDDLWQVLVMLTGRKAVDQIRREGRQIRGGGRDVLGLDEADAATVLDRGPSPDLVVQLAEEFQTLLDRLGDETLRRVALAKLEGYTNREIAATLGCIEQTVERKLRSIRRIWEAE